MSKAIDQLRQLDIVRNPVVRDMRKTIGAIRTELAHAQRTHDQAERELLTAIGSPSADGKLKLCSDDEHEQLVSLEREMRGWGNMAGWWTSQMLAATLELDECEQAARKARTDADSRQLPQAFLAESAKELFEKTGSFKYCAYHAALTGEALGERSPMATYLG